MTRNVIYSMGVSLDGFIAVPSGEIDWSARTRSCIGSITSRPGNWARTSSDDSFTRRWCTGKPLMRTPAAADYELEFALIWKAEPKIVSRRP